MKRLRRWLFNSIFVVSLVFFGTSALWVRSYYVTDTLAWHSGSDTRSLGVTSSCGELFFSNISGSPIAPLTGPSALYLGHDKPRSLDSITQVFFFGHYSFNFM